MENKDLLESRDLLENKDSWDLLDLLEQTVLTVLMV